MPKPAVKTLPQLGKRPAAARIDGEERWAQILEVATDLFYKKGFAATSMQDLSNALGLLKGSLYYYIRSKEELLFEILKGVHDDGVEIIAGVNLKTDDPLEELRSYLTRATVFAGTNAKRLSIFLRDFDNIPAERRTEIISERDMYVQTAERLIERGRKTGVFARSIDSHLSANLIMGAISSTHSWLRPAGRQPLEKVARQLAQQLTGGLLSSSY